MIKRFITAAVAGVVITLQLGAPVLAATDTETYDAAQKGIEYLAGNQNADGSISGFGGETEWSAIAITAAGQDAADFKQENAASATDFLKSNAIPDNAPATDVERKMLAIAASKGDLKNFGGVDYAARLQSEQNANQIGDPTLLNDDIFGVIAVDAAQDSTLHALAQNALDYFLAHQGADGGFSYTTDSCAFCGSDSNDTAAAIIAMYSAESIGLVNAGLASGKDKAILYLLSTQQPDGGFGYDVFSPSDGSSTAWSLMALNVIGSPVKSQAQAARNWLLANQNADGGFSYGAFGFTESSTSITAHAVLALLGSSWLLHPEPIQRPGTANPPSGQPPQTPSASTNQPSIIHSAATPATHAGQTAAARTESTPEIITQSIPQTKADQTPNPARAKDKSKNQSDESSSNYALYGIPVLGFVAIGWYVLQSRNKQEA